MEGSRRDFEYPIQNLDDVAPPKDACVTRRQVNVVKEDKERNRDDPEIKARTGTPYVDEPEKLETKNRKPRRDPLYKHSWDEANAERTRA
jgi:hypothetical protein